MKKLANIDIQEMYPAGMRTQADAGMWIFPGSREACHKVAIRSGSASQTETPSTRRRAFLQAFGGALVDAKAMSWPRLTRFPVARLLQELETFLPPDVPVDKRVHNKWLISGRGALIMNPPSAWTSPRRRAASPEQCGTHGFPTGEGRYAAVPAILWTIWNSRE